MPSVTKPKSNVSLTFDAIGTSWAIDLVLPPDESPLVSNAITKRIQEFDHAYSRFRTDSWVNRLSQTGNYTTPPDFEPLYSFYQKLHTATDGLITPLIGDALERAGYDAHYSLTPKKLQPIPDMTEALKLNGNTLHVKYKVCLDFGAAGKGYLVDILAELIQSKGIEEFLIDAGGDMYHHFPTPTPVGLENPANTNQAIGIANLQNASLCGSAGNRRRWAGFHHIMNPKKLASVEDISAVWVVVPHSDSNSSAWPTMIADGLATALFFVEPQQLNNFDFEYLVIKADNTVMVSPDFPGEIF